MRATCPSCDAVYEVPDRLIGSGRRLRCTNCGHEWTLSAAAGGAAGAAPESPAPSTARTPSGLSAPPSPVARAASPLPPPPSQPMLRRAPQLIDPPLPPVDDNTGRRLRGDLALRAAWAASVLTVALALGALWVFRHEIATAWPPASRLVGTPVDGG